MCGLILGIRIACTVIVFLIVTGLFFMHSNTREHASLQVLMAFLYIFDLDMVFQIFCKSAEAALLVLQLRDVSVYCIITMTLFFCVSYTGIMPSRLTTAVVGIWSILTNIGILFFYRIPGWFFKEIRFVEEGVYPHLEYTRGFWGILYETMVIFYVLLVMWNAMQYYRSESNGRNERIRKRILILAFLMPEAAYITYVMGLHSCYELNIIGLTLAASILLYASYRYRLFDMVGNTKDMMLENLDEGMAIYNEKKNLMYANRMAKELIEEIDRYVQEQTKDDNFEKNGKAYEIHGNEIYHEGQLQGYSYYILDVTEKKRQIVELESARKTAEAANDAKSNFLVNVSHELRTPLNGIIGMTEISLRSQVERESRFQLKSILSSAKNLLAFINNMLDLSKMEDGMLELAEETYHLEQIVYDAMSMICMQLGEKPLHIEARISPDVPGKLIGDQLRVQHILLNLLGNAVKYTKEGSVILEIYGKESKKGYELHIDVSDTGAGIKPEKMEEIFWKYRQADWRADKAATGTGLGLTLTKSLVERMGGTITVESEVGRGTTFYTVIYQQIESREKIRYTVLTSEMLKNGFGEEYLDRKYEYVFPGAKVLVVDDINTNLIVAQGLLEPYLLEVKCVNSADAAIMEIMEQEETYQLIFMDYMMPEKSGKEAVWEIRKWEEQHAHKATIIAMTADVTKGTRQHFIANGFSDYISKPIHQQKLEEILLHYLPEYRKLNAIRQAEENYEGIDQLEKYKINTEQGLANSGGSLKNYCRALEAYQKEMRVIFPMLQELQKKDLSMLGIKVHGIKSSSNVIGAIELGDLAGKLEAEIKEQIKTETHVSQNLEMEILVLKKKGEELLEGIQSFLKIAELQRREKRLENRRIGTEPQGNPMEHQEWWNHLKKAVLGYDAIMVERLLEEAAVVPNEEGEFLAVMKEQISMYDYAGCKKLLEEKMKIKF